jgi:hypothetical protein
MSPFVRIGAYGDYVNGMGMKSRRPRKLLINSDIDIRLFREPETEWIGIQTVGRGDAAGVASSSVNLHDERGLIGHITASCIANEMRPGNLFGRKTP